jgi:DNA-binding response OmpR family regulator
MMRILFINGRATVRQLRLAALLRARGFIVTYADIGNPDDAVERAVGEDADAILIDAPYFPQFAERVIGAGPVGPGRLIPIVVLLGEAEEANAYLRSRAEIEFVQKPVIPEELATQLRWLVTHTRRTAKPVAEPQTTASGISLEQEARRVAYGDRDAGLTPIEFHILSHLVESPGKVVTRRELARVIGGQARSNTVDVHIKNIRRKLDYLQRGLSGEIQTVRGVGYRIATEETANVMN